MKKVTTGLMLFAVMFLASCDRVDPATGQHIELNGISQVLIFILGLAVLAGIVWNLTRNKNKRP